ncbi:hypothetical protein, conserved [Eimeria necatrix]|uniref:Uncharacterized protein n=1 Tax=Eimeria necatrix TaxID=51315 RepID=U6N082_9EIME|nr:hypothetical protein, conserved [Eimeria necatrix]CDJ69607.1 hypothetical protein, conserved [Eimeria necatrix]
MESPQGDEHDFKEAGILSTGACRPSETEGGLAPATACPSAGAAGAAGEGNVGNSGSWGVVTADDAVSRSTALMERPDASSARPAGVTSSSDGDEDKRTYATRAGSEGRATEGFCRGTSAPESTATATETAEDAPATATDEPAPADEAAATGDVSLWSFWPSDWQVLPLNRLATLIIETLVSGGTSLQRDSSKHSSRTSSSRGRSSYNSRDSSLEHWRDRRSRNSRLRRKEHRDVGEVSSSEGTVESPCSCCSSSGCTSSDSGGDKSLLVGGASSRRLQSSKALRQRSRFSHQRLLRRSSRRRTPHGASTTDPATGNSRSSSSSSRCFSRDSSGCRDIKNTTEENKGSGGEEEADGLRPSLQNWMGTLGLQNVPLEKVIIPATHNSASWRVARLNEQQAYYSRLVQVWVSCQQLSIYEQLRRGIRWLDLRCCKSLESVTLAPRLRPRRRHRNSAAASLGRRLSLRFAAAAAPGTSSSSNISKCKSSSPWAAAEMSAVDTTEEPTRTTADSICPMSPTSMASNGHGHQHAHIGDYHPHHQHELQHQLEKAEEFEVAGASHQERQEHEHQDMPVSAAEEGKSTSSHCHHHHSKRVLSGQQGVASAAAAAAAHRDLALATGARRVTVAREMEQAGVPLHQSIPFCAHGGVLTVPLMRVFEEVHAFLVAHPTEVVFLSCVPDEGVVGETFCRLKEISATEVLFCVAASLGDFLGPGLEEGVTLADLVQRGQRLIVLWAHQEKCLPEAPKFPCKKGPLCSCRSVSGGRHCYASLVSDWVDKVAPIFSAANRSGGPAVSNQERAETTEIASAPGPPAAATTDTATGVAASARCGRNNPAERGTATSVAITAATAAAAASGATASAAAADAAAEAFAVTASAAANSAVTAEGVDTQRRTRITSFVSSPFQAGGSRVFKSFYRTSTLHPEELIKNLLRWASEEQRSMAVQKRQAAALKPVANNKPQHNPITFRMLCGEFVAGFVAATSPTVAGVAAIVVILRASVIGSCIPRTTTVLPPSCAFDALWFHAGEVTAPRRFAELPFIKYWLGQGVAVWKDKPVGIKTAAKAANKMILRELLKPLLQQVQEWAGSSPSSSSSRSGNDTERRQNPLEYINAFSHDFADRRIVTLLLRINCAMHCIHEEPRTL